MEFAFRLMVDRMVNTLVCGLWRYLKYLWCITHFSLKQYHLRFFTIAFDKLYVPLVLHLNPFVLPNACLFMRVRLYTCNLVIAWQEHLADGGMFFHWWNIFQGRSISQNYASLTADVRVPGGDCHRATIIPPHPTSILLKTNPCILLTPTKVSSNLTS